MANFNGKLTIEVTFENLNVPVGFGMTDAIIYHNCAEQSAASLLVASVYMQVWGTKHQFSCLAVVPYITLEILMLVCVFLYDCQPRWKWSREGSKNSNLVGFLHVFWLLQIPLFSISVFFEDFWGLNFKIFSKMTKVLSLRSGLDRFLFLNFDFCLFQKLQKMSLTVVKLQSFREWDVRVY